MLPGRPSKAGKDGAETAQTTPKIGPRTTLNPTWWRHDAALNRRPPPRSAIGLPHKKHREAT
eukprot:5953877-Pyramimonas_sp.AAC.1